VTDQKLKQAVEEAGYSVVQSVNSRRCLTPQRCLTSFLKRKKWKQKFKRLRLPVEGMTCASCVARVEKVLNKVGGVEKYNVNLATEKATIKFDPSIATQEQLAKVVEEAGYKLILPVINKSVTTN